jgi:hypothetical protein
MRRLTTASVKLQEHEHCQRCVEHRSGDCVHDQEGSAEQYSGLLTFVYRLFEHWLRDDAAGDEQSAQSAVILNCACFFGEIFENLSYVHALSCGFAHSFNRRLLIDGAFSY